jgi:hypothetical protein
MMSSTRIENIMSRVLEWAENEEVCDCEADARYEVEYCVNNADMTDDEIYDEAIGAWLAAE